MLTFTVRFIKWLLMFICVLLPLQLVGAILLLFVCPFMAKDQLRLPYLFRWFDNVDSYIGRDTSVYEMICSYGWWDRYKWLAWRNPINYFGYLYTGLMWDGTEVYTLYNPKDDDIGDTKNARPGFKHIEILHLSTGKEYFEYYWIYQYPFKKDVCFRFRMGWKIKDKDNPPGSISQFVFVISPWKEYSGK